MKNQKYFKLKKENIIPKENNFKGNDEFRLLTDLLLFSNNENLNLDNYSNLLYSDYNLHIAYFNDRLNKSSNISWGSNHWADRFKIILSLNIKKINQIIESHIIKNMKNILKKKKKIDIHYNTEYLQFVEFVKVKKILNKDLKNIRKFLSDIISYASALKINEILHFTIPYSFSSFEDYFYYVGKTYSNHNRTLKLFYNLNKLGTNIDKTPILHIINNILNSNDRIKSANWVFHILNDKDCIEAYKKIYDLSSRNKIVKLLTNEDYHFIDCNKFLNLKNLSLIDPFIIDEIVPIYLNKICNRDVLHFRANADKISKLIKTFPEYSPKKILLFLHKKKKDQEIKYLFQDFPDLEKLSIFL